MTYTIEQKKINKLTTRSLFKGHSYRFLSEKIITKFISFDKIQRKLALEQHLTQLLIKVYCIDFWSFT